MHIKGSPRFKHHQNSTRRTQEREERNDIVAGEGKKREILGFPPFGAPPLGSHPSHPSLLRTPTPWAPTLRGPHPSGSHPSGPHQIGQIGFGQNWPNQDGQKRIGHSTMATACEIYTFKAPRKPICFSYTIFLVSSSSDPFNSRCLADAEWSTGNLKDVQFHPTMNFWPFLGPPSPGHPLL